MERAARSAVLVGVAAVPVSVVVTVQPSSTDSFRIVGLTETQAKEMQVRVRSAMRGFSMPRGKVTVSVDLPPQSHGTSSLDLAVAVALLQVPLMDYMYVGELALDGKLRAVRGIIPLALLESTSGAGAMILPDSCADQAASVYTLNASGATDLEQVADFLQGKGALREGDPRGLRSTPSGYGDRSFDDVKGNAEAKHALMDAVRKGRNVLLVGPPGTGKTMLASRIPSILPPMSEIESLETSAIWSAAGMLSPDQQLVTSRPFRAPHHTASTAGVLGGGPQLRPGEVSLAHNGVLFLDELPEFRRDVIEALRQPMERGEVHVKDIVMPARFLLVAAANPCPCGVESRCACSEDMIKRYVGRIPQWLMSTFQVIKLEAVSPTAW